MLLIHFHTNKFGLLVRSHCVSRGRSRNASSGIRRKSAFLSSTHSHLLVRPPVLVRLSEPSLAHWEYLLPIVVRVVRLSGLDWEHQCIFSTQSEIGLFPADEESLYRYTSKLGRSRSRSQSVEKRSIVIPGNNDIFIVGYFSRKNRRYVMIIRNYRRQS